MPKFSSNSNSMENNQEPPSSARTLRSSSVKSGSKKLEKTISVVPSSTPSARAAHLQVEIKLLENEKTMREQALHSQEALERKTTEETLRRLEEKKALMEEEANIRQRQLQEEKIFQMKQQQIRQESLEKMQSIIRQMSECGSKTGSVHDSNQKVSGWLNEIHSDVVDTESESGRADPLPELKPPVLVMHHLNPDCANPSDQSPTPSTPPGLPNPIDQASNCTAQARLPLTTPSVSIPLGSSPLPKSQLPISEALPGISKSPRQQPVSTKPPIPRQSPDNPSLSDQPATMTDKPCLPMQSQRQRNPPNVPNATEPQRLPQPPDYPVPGAPNP
ncbi:uncharacterized protein DDB_G0284459-like [Wyeomyia smithii]|uniref:uncharacterized protein DDB_G0284459-like n=1 Tax=Wyeomyia smithii TaxID=174621 RepID=UPI002467B671|nr:uncharacterized protein DDB_G0284459-like [Wyeomyia smithii]